MSKLEAEAMGHAPRDSGRCSIVSKAPDRSGSMAKKRHVKLVEFDRNRAVLDMALGRVIVEAESVRFHGER